MISMGVRFKRHGDAPALFRRKIKYSRGGQRVRFPTREIEVQHRVNNCRFTARRVGQQIADCVSWYIEERLDYGLAGHVVVSRWSLVIICTYPDQQSSNTRRQRVACAAGVSYYLPGV